MLIRAASDTLALGRGQKQRATQGGGTDENLRGFFGHQEGAEHSLRGWTHRNDAVVLKEDNFWVTTRTLHKSQDFLADALRQTQPRIGIGYKNGLNTAHHNLIRTSSPFGKLTGPRGTKNLINGDGMDVPDASHPR